MKNSFSPPDGAEEAKFAFNGWAGEGDAVVDGLGEDEGGEDDGTIGGGDFDVRLVHIDAERYLPQVGIEGRTHGGDGKVGIEVCLATVGTPVDDYLATLGIDVDAVLLTGGV